MSPLSEEHSTSEPEWIPLYLPLTLPAEKWSLICVVGIPEIEDQLCFTQVHEALMKLQCQLMKQTYANHVESKIKAASWQYRTAWIALLNLRGPGIWEQTLQELHLSDIRGLRGGPQLAVGDGYRTLSWIWYSTAADEFNNTLFMEAHQDNMAGMDTLDIEIEEDDEDIVFDVDNM
ncbi:hypothetical protein L208DRAFT_1379067 [Tricholoma matsutake]|nr:hypothetical protein L208DRAFT_1379067 [Tricholoma matsutake 945]